VAGIIPDDDSDAMMESTSVCWNISCSGIIASQDDNKWISNRTWFEPMIGNSSSWSS
jgi:hypothetical protein